MLVNQTDIYALRAMTFLALQGADALVSSKDLAEKTRIPSHYLSKIMRRLVEAELVVSQKGHGGGFQIVRPLEEITIEGILDAMGDKHELEKCAFGWEKCGGEHPCPLHPAWSELKSSFVGWASSTNLSKLRNAHIQQRFLSSLGGGDLPE
ncbi:Rrf2 family transcriptional regulator [Myxococcota bacterium]|nr:Rrf2 family transcriptional regulator [Myxococcota bacterium]